LIIYCIQNKTKWIKKCKTKVLKVLDFVRFFDRMSHSIISKYYKWCYITIVFTKQPYFWESHYGWPGFVLRELGQIISQYMYVIKKLDTKKTFLNLSPWLIIYKCICNKYVFCWNYLSGLVGKSKCIFFFFFSKNVEKVWGLL